MASLNWKKGEVAQLGGLTSKPPPTMKSVKASLDKLVKNENGGTLWILQALYVHGGMDELEAFKRAFEDYG